MCGLAGFIKKQKHDACHLESVVTRMALAIQHRGPDDAGAWVDAQAGIALGHRRLSIVDLSVDYRYPCNLDSGGPCRNKPVPAGVSGFHWVSVTFF